MQLLLIIIGLLLFIGLVLIHELGHYIVARRGGVEVEEFGLGFPPRAYGKRLKSGMLLSFNWLPLGGFVRLKGEHDADRSPGSFGAAPLKTKVKIMLAGVAMNLIVALVLLTFVALLGMPKLITADQFGEDQFTIASDTKVVRQEVRAGYIEPGSPAEKAGLKSEDKLLAYGGASCASKGSCQGITSSQDLRNVTKLYPGQQFILKYERAGQVTLAKAQLRTKAEVEASKKTDQPKGYLGLASNEFIVQRSTWSAPVVAVGLSAQMTKLTLKGIGSALSGLGSTIAGALTGNTVARQAGQTAASEQVSGPVGIFFVLKASAAIGWLFMVMIIAIISLTLAIMNVLPIPALDGGRLFVTLIYRGLKKRLSQRTEERIHGTGMAVLMLLILLITVVDVKRFF